MATENHTGNSIQICHREFLRKSLLAATLANSTSDTSLPLNGPRGNKRLVACLLYLGAVERGCFREKLEIALVRQSKKTGWERSGAVPWVHPLQKRCSQNQGRERKNRSRGWRLRVSAFTPLINWKLFASWFALLGKMYFVFQCMV